MTRIDDNEDENSGFWNTFPSRTISLKRIFIFLAFSVVIIMPEELLDNILTLAHYAFEGFELILEEAIQHVFHVEKVESQLYVFYILMGLGAGFAFWLYRNIPGMLARLRGYLSRTYRMQKQRCSEYWLELSLTQKTLWLTVYLPLSLYLASFFLM